MYKQVDIRITCDSVEEPDWGAAWPSLFHSSIFYCWRCIAQCRAGRRLSTYAKRSSSMGRSSGQALCASSSSRLSKGESPQAAVQLCHSMLCHMSSACRCLDIWACRVRLVATMPATYCAAFANAVIFSIAPQDLEVLGAPCAGRKVLMSQAVMVLQPSGNHLTAACRTSNMFAWGPKG